MIKNYNDFINALFNAGFSGAIGGKDDGVFGLFRYGWGAEDESSIHWHTGDPAFHVCLLKLRRVSGHIYKAAGAIHTPRKQIRRGICRITSGENHRVFRAHSVS